MTNPAQAKHLPRLPAPPGIPVPGPSEAELRQGFEAVLSERQPGAGLWVFAYGALLWDRSFAWDEERVATLPGLARRYCLWDERNRGTPEHRSLTLGLIPGEACSGAALHLAEDGLAENFWTVWQHEMPPGTYEARWVDLETGAGPVRAVTFVADPGHPLFAEPMPDAVVARILASTSGEGGPALDYLHRTGAAMRERGVPDPFLDRLQALAAETA